MTNLTTTLSTLQNAQANRIKGLQDATDRFAKGIANIQEDGNAWELLSAIQWKTTDLAAKAEVNGQLAILSEGLERALDPENEKVTVAGLLDYLAERAKDAVRKAMRPTESSTSPVHNAIENAKQEAAATAIPSLVGGYKDIRAAAIEDGVEVGADRTDELKALSNLVW